MRFFNFIIAFFILSSNALASEKLVFAVDLIRHGDRAPLREIPKSPYVWKTGFGELTPEGIQQEIQLGEDLRKIYIEKDHLLPPIYDAKTIYVRSTASNRALMSADKFLLGLYPPHKRENADTKIPIVAFINKEDKLLATKPSKNIFYVMYRHYKDNQLWKEKTANLKEKLRLWSKLTGLPLKNFQQVGQLADILYIRQLHHIPLPDGIDAKDAAEIIALGKYGVINRFRLSNVTDEMGREFIKNVTNYFNQAMTSKTDLKYVFLSGHDSTVMSVLNTLQLPIDDIPAYASRLNFSLYENNKNYYIKINYNGKPVEIAACHGATCSIQEFLTFTN